MSNIVLLGASNSRIPGGLQVGLNQDDVNLVSLFVVKEDSNAIKNINYDLVISKRK